MVLNSNLVAFTLAAVAAVVSVGVEAEVVRRSDDMNLVTVVQQQAAAMQAMQARLTALETSVQRTQADLSTVQADVTGVKSSVDQLTAQTGKRVAFSAHMSTTHVDVGTNAPFRFDTVVTNIGDAYNGHNGIFTAPFNGIYAFYFDMMDDGPAPWIHAAIEKSGTILGVTSADGDPNRYDKGSVLVTTHLNQGDQVFVRRTEGGTMVAGSVYCHFSGFLLAADL